MATKRSLEELPQPAKKAKPLDVLSEEGPLRQDDVVYFQKEAIFRKMNLYKEQLKTVQTSLDGWKKEAQANADRLALLETWWGSVIELLRANGVISSEKLESVYSHKPEVLFVFPHLEGKEADDLLALRKKITTELLDPLIKSEPSQAEYVERIEKLTSELSYERARKIELKQTCSTLSSEIASLQTRVADLVHENDRLGLKTLKRTDEALMEKKEEPKEEEVKPVVKKEESVVPTSVLDTAATQEVENLNIKMAALLTKTELLAKQLEEANAQILASKLETTNLELRLMNLTEDDLQRSSLHRALVERVETLERSNSESQRKDATLVAKVAQLESVEKTCEDDFNAIVLEEKKALQSQLEKSEADLARIRNIRDELTSKVEVMSSQLKHTKVHEELTKTIDAQREEIAALKTAKRAELAKYADEKGDVASLKAQNEALLEELKDIEAAFNNAQDQLKKKNAAAVAHEAVVTKLSLEKSRADQKYFGAMRAKDAISNEMKTLRVQSARGQELVAQLKEFEKAAQAKMRALDVVVANLKTVSAEKTREIEALKGRSLEFAKQIEVMKKTCDTFSNDKKIALAKIQELEEAGKTLKRQIETLKTKVGSQEKLISKYRKYNPDVEKSGGATDMDDERIKGLISIAKCSICAVRFKSTALKTCGHVFCLECVNDRLNARLRKCPSCNCAFSFNDLLSVHL